VRSGSSRGSANISVDFGWGRDMTAATLQVDTALSHIMSSLPPGTTSVTRRMEPTVFPIIAYGLTSDKLSVTELRDLVKFKITPLLTTVPGLAKVDMVGGADAEVQVQVDPHKLDAYGLSLSDIVSALTAANVLQAIGRLEDHNKLYIVISNSNLVETEQVRDVVLRSDTHSVVRIRDVAEVPDIVRGVFQLFAGERPLRPVGACLAFRHGHIQQCLDEFRVADLGLEADAPGGDLRVEYRRHDALGRQIHRLQVLARSVNHLARSRGGQSRHQWIEAAQRQRVDAPDLPPGRQLQQTQLGKESAFAEEFRVHAEPRLRLQRARQCGQFIVSIDPNRVGHSIDPRVQFGIDYD